MSKPVFIYCVTGFGRRSNKARVEEGFTSWKLANARARVLAEENLRLTVVVDRFQRIDGAMWHLTRKTFHPKDHE